MLWDMRIGPGRLASIGCSPRIDHRVLAEHEERSLRDCTGCQLRRRSGKAIHSLGDMNGAGATSLGSAPRDRRAQRPVDLEGRVVVLKAAKLPALVRRHSAIREHLQIKGGCAATREDRFPGLEPLAVAADNRAGSA